MKAAIGTREVVTIDADDIRLRGTYHKPQDSNAIGVLFVSAGVFPKAGSGDSAVYWAGSLAKDGYPSFRFDLPGLGDSDDDFLTETVDFDSLVNDGAYGPVISRLVNHLAERFSLRGVVVIGHCAGAVTALYAAASNQRIVGLILLDPYFHVYQGNEVQNVMVRSHLGIVRKLVGDRLTQSNLREAIVKVLAYVRNLYHRLTPILRLVRRKRLPSTANLPLIRRWNQLASGGLPILVLRSPSSTPKPGEFDYVVDLQPLSGSDCRISVTLIEGTNHAFAERRGKEAVLRHTEQWLSACFPLTTRVASGSAEIYSQELADAMPGMNPNVR